MLVWLGRLIRWIAKPRLLWPCLSVPIACAFPLILSSAAEPLVRMTGLFLQLLGILTVVYGIERTRNFFGRPSLVQSAAAWLAEFPSIRGGTPTRIEVSNAGSVLVSGRLSVRHRAGPNANLEDRVRVLEGNVEGLENSRDELQGQLDQANQRLDRELAEERQDRGLQIKALGAQLETSQTGDLGVSLIGAIWLMMGLVLSTSSDEIAAHL